MSARVIATAMLAVGMLGACEPVRELTLTSALPSRCVAPDVNEVRVRALGDFAPGMGDSLSLGLTGPGAVLTLPRATRVVSVEGLGPTGLVAFGRTAPMELPATWDAAGSSPRIALVYGAPNTVCATASLSYARAFHKATMLADGSVLMSGGINYDGLPVVSLERYLPAGDADQPTARFARVAPGTDAALIDNAAVLGHDATLLADGTVLLSGGAPAVAGLADGIAYQGASVLSAQGAVVGAPRVLGGGPRAFHAGLRLADGRVLLTGGCSELTDGRCAAGRAQSSVAIYDPKLDQFTAGLPLLAPRAWHRALLRDDGLVVLIGGVGEGGAALPPELYDPNESRGSSLSGPAGASVTLASGLVVTLNDAAGASSRVLAWSGLDEPPQLLAQLASARAQASVTALEDGGVLFAGGWDGRSLVTTSAVLGPAGQADPVSGFVARGHSATLLRDGTVLLAGGIDPSGHSSASADVFLRSLAGAFDTPSTLAFDGPLTMTPSRAGRVRVENGALTIDAASTPSHAIDTYALVPGASLAGPSTTGFSASLLAGSRGDVEVALVFGDPAATRYIAVLLSVGSAPRLLSVTPDRPGLPAIEEVAGCTVVPVEASELPSDASGALTFMLRNGTSRLASATRTLMTCDASSAPPRGYFAVGVRTRSSGGSARFDNLQLTR